MQICPLYEKAPVMHLPMISGIFTIDEIITPAFPPSSRMTFFLPDCFFRFHPTSGEPVKLNILTSGCVASLLPVSRVIGKIETDPGGKPLSAIISASSSVDNGVADAGLRMIGHPAASAGAILCTARFIGKLKGEIPATMPAGKYFTKPSLFFPLLVQSRLRYSFGNRLLSSAAIKNVWAALSISA